MEKTIKFILFIGVIVGIYAILQKIGIDIYSEERKELFVGRSFATLGNPNSLGQFLLLPIWISIMSSINTKGRWRFTYMIGLLILLMALLFTENRASILGLIFGLSVFFILSKKISKLIKYFFVFSALIVFTLVIIFLAPSLRSIQSRIHIWETAPQIIREYPLFGGGLETFEQLFIKVSPPEIYNYEHIYSTTNRAHNEILDIVTTQGLLGLSIYLVALVILFYLFFKKKKTNDTLTSIAFYSLISILISRFFGFQTIVDWVLFYTILAIFCVNLFPIKKQTIKRNLSAIFISGIVSILLLFNILNAGKTLIADNYLNKGLNEFESGEMTRSISDLLFFNKLNPYQDVGSYLTSSIIYIFVKDTTDTDILADFEEITKQGGRFTNYDYRYHIEHARLLVEQNKFDEAEEHLKKSSNLAPFYPFLYKEWTYKYYKEGNFKSAIEKGEKFLEISPKYWQWKNDLENKTEEEKTQYRIFFKTTPGFTDIFGYLSESYRNLGDSEKAEFYYYYIK